MPHRYLPEHVVLSDAPKPMGYTQPLPCVVECSRKYAYVRARMARANDDGVGKLSLLAFHVSFISYIPLDVLDVLLSEYRLVLIRKGYRQADIGRLYKRAENGLDNERRSPRGE
jgi:hypothetical protein